MTVTITAEQFVDPVGPFTGTLFPDTDRAGRLAQVTSWLATAAALTPVADAETDLRANKLAALYVYYLGYTAVWERMAAEPINVQKGENKGGSSYNVEQIKLFRDKAQEFLDAYTALVDVAVTGPAEPPYGPVRTIFTT